MQTMTGGPREGLTEADVIQVLRLSPAVKVSAGVDLLDTDDVKIADISDELVRSGSEITSGSFRDLHRGCRLKLSEDADWGKVRLRPRMTVTDRVTGLAVTAHLGVYLPGVPKVTAGETPRVWDVTGYDKLHILDTPIGNTWSVAAGAGALAAVRALIEDAGETAIRLSSEADDIALPSGRTWPVSAESTYRRAVNDLLGMVGYRGVSTDWDGTFRSEPYVSPATRAAEWDYDVDDDRVRVVSTFRTLERDWFDVPNVWIGRRKDDPEQGEPVDGDGLYTVRNKSDGPTSIDGRGGREVRRVIEVDAATQTSLVNFVDRAVEADKSLIHRVELSTAPNPLHWHQDVVSLVDTELGLSGRWLSQEWTLPLDGSDMRHVLKAV